MTKHFTELNCERMTVGYDGRNPVLREINLRIRPGERIAVIGPNAAGKSTLLKAMAGDATPISGRAVLNGQSIQDLPDKARARVLTRVPQRPKIQAAFSVREFVAMGRYPHQSWGRREQHTDMAAIEKALLETGLREQAGRPVNQLSGGEQQRVILAQALAQDTSVLLLDEPNTFLDIRHQFSLLDTLFRLNQAEKLTIVLVLHDLNLAASFAERVILMHDGRVVLDGDPKAVLTAESIQETYGVKATRMDVAGGRYPHFVLWPLVHGSRAACTEQRQYHIVGGGGSAGSVIQSLAEKGHLLSLGVIGQGDTDQQVAEFYGVDTTMAPAFSEIPEALFAKARGQIEAAEGIILTNLCFGRGNLGNLQLVVEAAIGGKKIWIIDETPIESRDYTGGEAARLYKELVAMNVTVVPHAAYLPDYLEERRNPENDNE